MSRGLLLVDVQRDFLTGGALAVPDGDAVIAPIADLLAGGDHDLVVASRDWHPPDHASFRDQGGPWPVHCVRGTPGAEIDPGIDLDRVDAVLDKGVSRDGPGYSIFENRRWGALLQEHGVDELTLAGLATDVCVGACARDALAAGLRVRVMGAAVRGIDPADSARTLAELQAAGARVL